MLVEVKAKAAAEDPRVLSLVLPVAVGATATIVAAAVSFAQTDFSPSLLAGLLALFAAATFTEVFPLPIRGIPIGRTSLASVFLIGTAVLYGWAPATLLSFLMQLTVETGRRRPLVRVVYNSSVYALAAAAGGAAAAVASRLPFDPMLTKTTTAAAAFYGVDLLLVALIVAQARREPFVPLLRQTIGTTSLPLVLMVCLSVVLVVLWDRSPFLIAALFGPLIAYDLYQRSQLRTLEAMHTAVTDPVTGLGNRRRFDERMNDEVPPSKPGSPISVCLLDIDGLKRINDSYGHPFGDRALAALGARLASSGEAFRLGGDEFALLLPGIEPEQARLLVELVLVDLVLENGHGEPINVSCGIAAYPRDGETPQGLVDRADEALYFSKRHAPGGVSAHSAEGLGLRAFAADSPADRAMRLQTATSLARGRDSRDALGGSHSQSVGSLAARIGARMGWEAEQCKLLELAGRLHDLGKVAIPDEVLEKDGPLAPDERRLLERHPVIGSNMLTSLGLGAVSGWVLHHHERWDGTGYPDKLAGEAIPPAARILAAADAFDALTSDRVYRERLTDSQALDELERGAGTQFDPNVVATLVAEVTDPDYDF
ncbi:MAG TPA: HD domain-containing phosphohydrolase [Gaiellaceae bacterium]|nr:HD domain-containing phosphohydrolase [Gaiellaceae bacterium]